MVVGVWHLRAMRDCGAACILHITSHGRFSALFTHRDSRGDRRWGGLAVYTSSYAFRLSLDMAGRVDDPLNDPIQKELLKPN